MNIWLVQTGEPLPLDSSVKKMRTALLADRLVERGHSVLWWASAYDHFKKKWTYNTDTEINIGKNLKIFALKGIEYRKNISLTRFLDHRIIAWKFKKLALKKVKPDIIVSSVPSHDLAHQSVMFAKRNKIPVIVDIRDEWPDLFVNIAPFPLRWLLKLILFNDFRMINKTMRHADSLLAMIGSLLKWGLNYAGRAQTENDKIFYLGGTRIHYPVQKINLSFAGKLKDKFVVVFVGTFVENNDPSIIIECAKKLRNEAIHFVLAGDGELLNSIKENAKELGNITFTGWLNPDEINELLKYSNVGIAPTKQVRSAFPNKVFSYFSAGIPVITAFCGDLKEILEKHGTGLYYPPNDAEALSNCILKLYNEKNPYKLMSANTIRIFNEMFDSDRIYEEYANHVELMAEKYKMK